MRTINEILDEMNPELRTAAEDAISEMKVITKTLSTIPSPDVLAGQPLDRDDDFLDERYGDNND